MAKQFKGKTIIAAILDRSGSMANLVNDMIGGYNTWLAEQQTLPGEATITTTIFDTKFDLVGEANTPIKEAKPLTREVYFARGSTALNDAVGKTVAAMKDAVGKKDRALVLIVTDGQENSSQEWTSAQTKQLITELEGKGNWTFAYLSSAPSAWFDAQKIGTQQGSTQVYAATNVGTRTMWSNVTASTQSYRGATGQSVSAFFDPDDAADQNPAAPETTTATAKTTP